jgi:hypothetical protein
MALIPSARYAGQTDAATEYPHGKARNAGAFQDGTGTPLERDWLNDLWGFLQSLLEAAGITPSGDPDEVGASQYLEAVQSLAVSTPLATTLRRMMQLRQINLNGVTPPSDDQIAVASTSNGRTLFVEAGANGVFWIADTSLVELGSITATGLIQAQGIAFDDDSGRHVAVGNGSSSFSTNDGETWTAGGATGLGSTGNQVVWSGTHFVGIGSSAVKRSTNAVSWANPTTPPGGDSNSGIALMSAGRLILARSGAGGGLFESLDGGDTWALVSTTGFSTTLLNIVTVYAGRGDGEIFAFVKAGGFDPSDECEVWRLSAALVWEKRATLTGHLGVFGDFRAWQCHDTGLLVVATEDDGFTVLNASADLGYTWSPLARYNATLPEAIGVANGRIVSGGNARVFATDPLL